MLDGEGAGDAGDVARRMAQVVGDPPRIEPLASKEMTAQGRALIDELNASLGLETPDWIPEYFLTMIRHPALFRCQMQMGAALFAGTIGPRERELAVLRVGWLCAAPYEWGEHVELGKRFGLSGEEIERVTVGSSAPGWSEHDAAILRGVEELLDDKAITDATWDALAREWSEQQLLEFPMLVGAYVTTAFQQNAVKMRLAPTNPGLGAR